MNTDQNISNEIALIKFIVENIVTELDKISIETTTDERGVLITLRVAKDDMGKVIGRNGQTANALRVLLNVVASKQQNNINLKIEEPLE